MNMIYETDPFIKDEIGLELDVFASRFATARNELNKLGLNDEEKTILEGQQKVIFATLALQREVAEMALSDNPQIVKQAQKLMIEEVYAGQGEIIDYFMKLLNYKKKI